MTDKQFSDFFSGHCRSVFVRASLKAMKPGSQSRVGFVTLCTTRPHACEIIEFFNNLPDHHIHVDFKKGAGTAGKRSAPGDGAERSVSGNSGAKKKPNNGSINENHSSEHNQGKATDNNVSTSIIRDSVSPGTPEFAHGSDHDSNSSNGVSIKSILMQPLYFRSSPGVGQAIHGYFLRTSMDDGVHEPVDLMYLSEEDVKSMLESLGCNTKICSLAG